MHRSPTGPWPSQPPSDSASPAAAALLAGIVVKASGNRRGLAAGLLVLGSPAPALAWFWLPPVYLVSIAIAVLALVSMAYRPDATAVAA